MRRRAVLTVLLLVPLTGSVSVPAATAAAPSCARGTLAVVDGKQVCLRKGRRCAVKLDRRYAQFGYRCRRAKRSGRRARQSRLTLGRAIARRYGEPVAIGADGRIDKATALQAFAATIGPLPGVRVPKGAVTPLESATGPLRWVELHRRSLTARQRVAIDRYRRQLFPEASAASADLATANRFLADAVKAIEKHVGEPLNVPVKAVFSTAGEKHLATAQTVADAGGGKVCLVTVTKKGLAVSDADLRSTLEHEAFHCFQTMWNASGYSKETLWLWEGSATFAEAALAAERGVFNEDAAGWWADWLIYPDAPLFSRAYSAVGFFGHLDQAGIDFWKVIKPMIKASGRDAAYALAVEAPPQGRQVLDTWAPSYFRIDWPGPGWDFKGPALPAHRARVPKYRLGNGSRVPVASAERAAGVAQVTFATDVVTVAPGGDDVRGRMTDFNGDQNPLVAASYCTKPGGCACPGGKLGPPSNLGGALYVGVTGHKNGARVVFKGEKLSSWCKRAPAAGDMRFDGAVSGRVTTAGECTTRFAGNDGFFLSMWNSDVHPYWYINMNTENWRGVGTYPIRGHGVGSDTVFVSDGNDRTWHTDSRPREADGGSFTVTSETATTITGTVQAYAYNRDEGTSVTVSGSWSCNRD